LAQIRSKYTLPISFRGEEMGLAHVHPSPVTHSLNVEAELGDISLLVSVINAREVRRMLPLFLLRQKSFLIVYFILHLSTSMFIC
jgi:hypothetical protein